MKNRCFNRRGSDYAYYGERGITVCERWIDSFENFFVDMKERPSAQHTLDRINNEAAYSKANCRWATRQQQAQNRRPSFHTMNQELADVIRFLYAKGQNGLFQYEIAELYGFTQTDISQVTRNARWARGRQVVR